MSYQITVSHGNGPRHLELFDNYLLGIGAHAPIRYPHWHPLRPLNTKFSDRYGRVQYLSLNFTAVLLADAALAALAVAPDYVPGGYWLIVYVSAFEGLIGGRGHLVDSMTPSDDLSPPPPGSSAAFAATHAYLADCSDSASRSTFISQPTGRD